MASPKPIQIILARQFASTLAMPILIVDTEGTLIFFNEPAEVILRQRWGTRGSLATPDPDMARYGGNTSCVGVYGRQGTMLVLDAGTRAALPAGLRRALVGAGERHARIAGAPAAISPRRSSR